MLLFQSVFTRSCVQSSGKPEKVMRLKHLTKEIDASDYNLRCWIEWDDLRQESDEEKDNEKEGME